MADVIHPGSKLKPKVLKKFGSVQEAGRQLGIEPSSLGEFLNGRRGLPYSMALKLEGGLSKVRASALLKQEVDFNLAEIKRGVLTLLSD